MGRSVFFRIVMALVLIGALVGIGFFAYQAGMAQGAAQTAQLAQPAQAAPGTVPAAPYPYYMMPYWHPWPGFWFWPFGCLIPLFFIFLAFAAFRGLFGRGPRMMGYMHHRGWDSGEPGKDIPPYVEEWHRRMHEQPAVGGEPTDKPAA